MEMKKGMASWAVDLLTGFFTVTGFAQESLNDIQAAMKAKDNPLSRN